MENKEFYIKYHTNHPVPVDTSYGIGPQGTLPLVTVGHLIAAFFPSAEPSTLAQYTVHSINNEVETSYNSWDPLTVLGKNGRTGTSPLIIKSKNDAVGINSKPQIRSNRLKEKPKVQGNQSSCILTTGNEMDIDTTPEKAINELKDMINLHVPNKNYFFAQDSMKDINLEGSILNLKIKSMDGVPNLLYSEEINEAEKKIGIEMPIDKLIAIENKTIVMIGVSGCGKTRTCYDFCRYRWALYFDCTLDADFILITKILNANAPAKKTIENQVAFEKLSERLIECLISARLLVFKTIFDYNATLKCFDWLCIQRSKRSRDLFYLICTQLSKYDWSVSHDIYLKLKGWLYNNFTEFRVIFDESQHMLDLLKLDYHSISSDYIKNDGSFAFPRSFFLFMSRTIIRLGFSSIWCGTKMRTRCMELSANYAPEGIYLFTNFNFLEPCHIFKLLSKWLNVDVSENCTF